jgi:hypothetical protein
VIFLDTCVLYDVYSDGQELDIMNQEDTVYVVTKTPLMETSISKVSKAKLIDNKMFGKISFLDDHALAPKSLKKEECIVETVGKKKIKKKSHYNDYRGRLEAAYIALHIDV